MDVELFLGYPLSKDLAEKFSNVKKELLALFIQSHPDYLQETVYRGQRYLGKRVGSIADLDALFLLQENILSLLKKIVPDHSYHKKALILFPLHNHE
ncbi:MAG: hypothetical protein ACSNEK_02045 [Parachlamydiaceae bacterium]